MIRMRAKISFTFQSQGKSAALAELAFAADITAEQDSKLLAEMQAEPCSF